MGAGAGGLGRRPPPEATAVPAQRGGRACAASLCDVPVDAPRPGGGPPDRFRARTRLEPVPGRGLGTGQPGYPPRVALLAAGQRPGDGRPPSRTANPAAAAVARPAGRPGPVRGSGGGGHGHDGVGRALLRVVHPRLHGRPGGVGFTPPEPARHVHVVPGMVSPHWWRYAPGACRRSVWRTTASGALAGPRRLPVTITSVERQGLWAGTRRPARPGALRRTVGGLRRPAEGPSRCMTAARARPRGRSGTP